MMHRGDASDQEAPVLGDPQAGPTPMLPYFTEITSDRDWVRLLRRVSWLALIVGLISVAYYARQVQFAFGLDRATNLRVLGWDVFGVPLYGIAQVVNAGLALLLIGAAAASLVRRPAGRTALMAFAITSIVLNVPIMIANQLYYLVNRPFPGNSPAPPVWHEVLTMIPSVLYSTAVVTLLPLILLLTLSLPGVRRLDRHPPSQA